MTPPTGVPATNTPKPPTTPSTPPDTCTPGLIIRKFHDLNGDGQRQPDEPMLQGISFDVVEQTDGPERRHNVTTGADGAIYMRFQGDTVVRVDELTRTTGMWAPSTQLRQTVPLGCETVEVWVPNTPLQPPKTGNGGNATPTWLIRLLGTWPLWVLDLLIDV